MSRTDQYNVTVVVAYRVGGNIQTRQLGTFDTFSGGAVTSDTTKFYPGGMGEQLSLGGRRSVENVTVGRLYDLRRDHPIVGWLMGGVGKADVTITKTSLDVDEVALASPLVYRGKLESVTPPDHDSDSTDAAMLEMEVSSATVTQN